MRRDDVWAFDAWERHPTIEVRLKPKRLLAFFGSLAIADIPTSRSIGQKGLEPAVRCVLYGGPVSVYANESFKIAAR